MSARLRGPVGSPVPSALGRSTVLLLAIACGQFACSKAPEGGQSRATAPEPAAASTAAASPGEPPPLAYESALPDVVRKALHQEFKGDLDGMVKRRLIRVGVTYNRTNYFVDNGVPRGTTYEHLKHFEDRLNQALKTGLLRIHVVCVPKPRDTMLKALVDGEIDMAEGQLTITPERQALVDFGVPYRENVNEIVVTGPGADPVGSVDDLAGREVFVRKSSSYYQSLLALNKRLEAGGRKPVALSEAPENLEDDDLLEMTNAGLIQNIVVDDYLARFWKQVLPKLNLHTHAVLRSGGALGVAFRKNSPVMADAVAKYTERFGLGTAFGNVVQTRYLQSTRFVKSATAKAERRKFEQLIALFRTYGRQYDLDYLLMAAQGYQESRLDPKAKSRVGAVGVMQVMPKTGAELKVGDIRRTDANVHAGIKYIRYVVDTYYKDEPMTPLNKVLFAFASYNAGPNRIRDLRKETAQRGLDPNIWFGNVEQVVSARVGRETVDYVSNIFKYYVAYRLVTEEQERRASARTAVASQKK
jgi:membrane-bound lytic murein transglycosylase MltF